MNRQKKYEIAAEAVKNGIGPDQLRAMLNFIGDVDGVIRKAFDENMKVLDELYPEEEKVMEDCSNG